MFERRRSLVNTVTIGQQSAKVLGENLKLCLTFNIMIQYFIAVDWSPLQGIVKVATFCLFQLGLKHKRIIGGKVESQV